MKKLLRLILGFGIGGIIVGTIAMRVTVRMRQQSHVFPVYLAPCQGDEATEKTAQQCAEIIRKRIAYLRRLYSVERSSVKVASPSRLDVELLTHVNIGRLKATLVKRFAIELRLVHEYDFSAESTPEIPDNAELLDEVQQLYDLREIGKVNVKRTPRLVAKTPELVISQLASAKFITRSLRRDPIVLIEMHPADSARFAEITKQHIGKRLAVVIDGEIRTAPLVKQPITGGRAEIHGITFKQEARDVAAFLNMGALPCHASLTPA